MNQEVTRFRPVRMGRMTARAEHRDDGLVEIVSVEPLGTYPRSILDAIEAWAQRTPDALMVADRNGESWRRLTYGDVLGRIPALAQSLLDAGLSVERPLLILSGN